MGQVRALRGATTVASDDAQSIIAASMEMLTAILDRNQLVAEDLISIVFTATADLTAAYPAVGARRLGLTQVPLLCMVEMPVEGSLPRCILCLLHIHTHLSRSKLHHVYLREARQLRPDLADNE